jgi:hypothetical protein
MLKRGIVQLLKAPQKELPTHICKLIKLNVDCNKIVKGEENGG